MSFGLFDFNVGCKTISPNLPQIFHLLFTCSAEEPCVLLSQFLVIHGVILQPGLVRRSEIQRCAMKSGAPLKPETDQGCADGWKKACKVETVSRQRRHAVIPEE